jgi:hypothetical protein
MRRFVDEDDGLVTNLTVNGVEVVRYVETEALTAALGAAAHSLRRAE